MLGAAGCGYEYDDPKYKCEYLSQNQTGFVCLKYNKDLEIHNRSGEPFRLKQCGDDADEYWENKMAEEKRALTNKIRNGEL